MSRRYLENPLWPKRVNKEVTAARNIRFLGECDDSHCDRFWAEALRHHAAYRRVPDVGAVCV